MWICDILGDLSSDMTVMPWITIKYIQKHDWRKVEVKKMYDTNKIFLKNFKRHIKKEVVFVLMGWSLLPNALQPF